MTMAATVYALCAATALLCAVLLLKGYLASRTRLLFYASLCFVGLAVNNLLLFVDLVLLPRIDLSLPRAVVGLVAVCTLLFGLIWEAR
jgi:hypothetical protein